MVDHEFIWDDAESSMPIANMYISIYIMLMYIYNELLGIRCVAQW